MILEKKTQKNIDYKLLKQLSRDFKIKEELLEIMFLRDINTHKKVEEFLNPDIKNFNDPFLFKDMQLVVDKINHAIANNHSIVIFGDYDVDGMSATSILYLYLKEQGAKVNFFLPNRYVDEYGLTKGAIDKVVKQFAPKLVITVDCGITATEEVDYLHNLGIEVLITDHHEVPSVVPNCPIINPKRNSETYPYSELCGAGVALKVVHALGGVYAMEQYLDIAALATIADIVDLRGENRLIVQLGLKRMKEKTPEGLKLLFKELKLDNSFTSVDIAFKVAPKINASGRMGRAEEGLKLLIEKDKKKLAVIVKTLIELNTLRQELCQKVYEDALVKLQTLNLATKKVIVLSDSSWDAGLLGITAARLAEEFNKPTLLFSYIDGKYKGSARSIDGIDIHKAISCIQAPIEAFGGHTMAAGLTISKDNFKAFSEQLDICMDSLFDATYFYPKRYYDLDLSLKDVNLKLLQDLELLSPFGHNNPVPIFNLAFSNAKVAPMKNYPEHLTITFDKNFGLLNFNAGDQLSNYTYYKNKNALIELQKNTFRGRDSLRGIVKTINFSTLNTKAVNGFIKGNHLKQLFYNKFSEQKAVYQNYDIEGLEKLLQKTFTQKKLGNLIVTFSVDNYKKCIELLKDHPLSLNLFRVGDKLGLNSICLGLDSFENLNSFTNIIFLEEVLGSNFIDALSLNTKAAIFLPNIKYNKHYFKISTNRQIFALYFTAFKNATRQKVVATDIYSYFNTLKGANPHIVNFNFSQFIACVKVFVELNIIQEVVSEQSYQLRLNKQVKSLLENSYIYNQLNAKS